MPGVFQSPPTFTLPISIDPITGEMSFSPIWINWFLELTARLDSAGLPLLLNETTLNGELIGADNVISGVFFRDVGEVVVAIGNTGGGTQDFDIELGNVFTATVTTSANTFTFSHPSPTGYACSITIILTNGGSQTVNWPASVDWTDGTAPDLTVAGVDVLEFLTVNAGTTWHGFASSLDSS
jgi:hypothetical protein